MDELSRGWALYTRGEYGEAETVFQAVLDDPATPSEARFQARFNLGFCWASRGRFDPARAIYTQLRLEAQASGHRQLEHVTLHQLGMVNRLEGHWEAAQACFAEEAHMIAALGHDDLAVAINTYERGLVALQLGRMVEARTHFETSLLCSQRTTDAIAIGCAHRGLGDWYAAQEHAPQAAAEWEHALRAFRAAGNDRAVLDVMARLDSTNQASDG